MKYLAQSTINAKFKANHPGANVITPDVIKIDQSTSGDYIYELSKGTDMEGDAIYGVTVMELGGYGRSDENRHDLSKLFQGQPPNATPLSTSRGYRVDEIKRGAREYRARLERREQLCDTWALIIVTIVIIILNTANIL